ncbi:zinc finger protein 239-like isoform X2 [Artemia franciscana]|uniref:C2H2-type domain-containing protein n=1 Tax=Artemia franciscana TaxID=6661 RepID=A0AA88L064_ARTSF|nr:hypothetical protein QYM36_014282 [Artemia franciscana]
MKIAEEVKEEAIEGTVYISTANHEDTYNDKDIPSDDNVYLTVQPKIEFYFPQIDSTTVKNEGVSRVECCSGSDVGPELDPFDGDKEPVDTFTFVLGFENRSLTKNSYLDQNLHRRSLHILEKPYECEICQKNFSRRAHLNLHQRTHTGDKPHQCELCKKNFSNPSGLRVHRRIHTGDKPYQCEECKKSFSDRSAFNVHKKIHTGERPYQCTTCQKSFYTSSSLTRHNTLHSGVKPYQCEVCKESFSERGSLTRHKKIHTGDKPYQCEVCKKGFFQSSNLTQHRKVHTK